jgi:hypothetical protein
MDDWRPPIPWAGLFVSGYAFLTGLGAGALAPLMFAKALWFGGFLALVIGGTLGSFGVYEGTRCIRQVRGREAVGKKRRELYEDFERRFEAAPEEERGNLFADELEAILEGKRQ